MNRTGQLVKNTAVIAIGKICTQFAGFLLLPLYTAVLTTEENGIVDVLNTYLMLLLPLIIFQVEQAEFRFLLENRENPEKQDTIISTVVFFSLFQSCVFAAVFCIVSHFIAIQYPVYFAALMIATLFSNVLLQIPRGFGNNILYSKASFIIAAVTLVLNVVTITKGHMGARGMLFSSVVGNISGSLYIFASLKLHRKIKPALFKFTQLKLALKYSLPLVPDGLSWWIITASDKTIVQLFLGLSMNGILMVAQKFSSVYVATYNIFQLSWLEMINLHYHDEDRDTYFEKLLNQVLNLYFSAALLIIAVMPFVFPILININYHEAYYQIPIYMVSSFFNVAAGLFGSIYIAAKYTKGMPKTTILAGVINIAINITLISHIGLFAASISSFLAYFAIFIVRYIDTKRFCNIHLYKKNAFIYLTAFIIVICFYYSSHIALEAAGLLFTVVLIGILNYRILISFMKYFKNFIKKNRQKENKG